MPRSGVERKPAWRQVPAPVRERTAALLGAPAVRAVRAYGGYGPSATFRLRLAGGRRAFFKGIYPVPEGSPIRWSLDHEQRVFERLGTLLQPWVPAYYGAVRHAGWHALLMEDVGPATVPPWSTPKARAAMRAYGEFHARTYGHDLPRWLPRRRGWAGFALTWRRLAGVPRGLDRLAGLAGEAAPDARTWLRRHVSALDTTAQAFARTPPPYALLHLDTRSDNVRVHPRAGAPLRIFDWPAARVGPPELDLMGFVQSIVCEDGPPADALVGWYAGAMPVRPLVLARAAAALAGFFAARAWQPDVADLPRLRSIQRRQLRASLTYAAHLLDLPPPTWLEAVPS